MIKVKLPQLTWSANCCSKIQIICHKFTFPILFLNEDFRFMLIKVFISYSHKDKRFNEELKDHLTPLGR